MSNQLIAVRSYIFYTKRINEDETEEFVRHNEIVLCLDKPEYIKTTEGQIIRDMGVEELRFTVSTKGLESLIEQLQQYKDCDEKDLH